MEVSVAKKVRAANYTNEEKFALLNIIEHYKHIIECKKTDKITWKDKDRAWQQITEEFNTLSPNNTHRSTESLKKFYDNKKKEVRKEFSREKMEILKTGGGTAAKINDPTFQATLSLMNMKTVRGLCNEFDGDATMVSTSNEPANKNYNNYDVEILEDGLTEEEMRCIRNVGMENVGMEKQEVLPSEHKFVERHNTEQLFNAAASNNSVNYMENGKSCSTIKDTEEKRSVADWGNYTPTLLKAPKSHCLNIQTVNKSVQSNESRRKQIRRPQLLASNKSNISQQYSDLAEIKIELAKTQLEALKGEIKRKEEREIIEFELKKKSLELDIQIKEIQLRKLQSFEYLM